MSGVLSGLKVLEFEGLGPAPFCGAHLADLGADVIVVDRPGAAVGLHRRGKRAISLNLKDPGHRDVALRLAATVDVLIEGFRPGVMERLGLGPEAAQAANPRLVYGRLTGWGQDGPLAPAAGHDVNYVSLSGAAWYAGAAGETPLPPPTLVGDVGGGALYLAVGILAGVLKARETGRGTVVDAAVVDGAAHMTGLLLALRAGGGLPEARGQSMIDGAPFYGVYRCADGASISVGPLEPKFYALLVEKLGLADDPDFAVQFDAGRWPAMRAKLAARFAAEASATWRERLEGTDVCFAPVLSPSAAAAHPHMAARRVYRETPAGLQAAAAPRFDGAAPDDPAPVPAPGAHTAEILAELGLDPGALDAPE